MRVLMVMLAISLGTTLASCGDDRCKDSSDCTHPEQCLWVEHDGRITGQQCVKPCASDSECPSGQTCTGEAVSCANCKDVRMICEDAER
jgi:hypothetical protein